MTTPDQYAQAVRDALADHPEREELLEDLDDHLAEIAEESDVPLEERLGPPSAYAEELVAAYGGRPTVEMPRSRWRPGAGLRRAHGGLMAMGPYRSLVAFLPELRPGWWVLRGYAVGMLLLAPFTGAWLVPGNPIEWLVVGVVVWASVWFGRRSHGRVVGVLLVLANAAAGLIVLGGLIDASHSSDREPVSVSYAVTGGSPGFDVSNIKPYAKDGTPLTDVYLYDQDGNPITTNPESRGYKVCGEPVLNRYPLTLVERFGQPEAPCPTPTPSPSKS